MDDFPPIVVFGRKILMLGKKACAVEKYFVIVIGKLESEKLHQPCLIELNKEMKKPDASVTMCVIDFSQF